MNDLLLSLAMAALGQLGGYGATPGMGGGPGIGIGPGMGYRPGLGAGPGIRIAPGMGHGIRIGIRGGGVPIGMPVPYGGYPASGPVPVYPGGITPGTGYPITTMPQRPSSARPAPSSEAEAFGLAPYR